MKITQEISVCSAAYLFCIIVKLQAKSLFYPCHNKNKNNNNNNNKNPHKNLSGGVVLLV